MNDIQIFQNDEFGSVRTLIINNEPWFVGKDVAGILGYTNPSKALIDYVDDEDKFYNKSLVSLGQRGDWLINEPGLYSLIISSKLPNAKKFKHWITSEVLPSIRKNGGYIANQEKMTPEQIVANALVVANNIINEMNAALLQKGKVIYENDKRIEEMRPKEEFFNAVTDSKDAIPMSYVAEVLDMGIGRNKLFKFLRKENILQYNNQPYQRYIDSGYFRIVEQRYEKPYGEIGINIKTFVSQSGVDFIRKRLLKAGYSSKSV